MLCRRARHLEFKRAWLDGNRELVDCNEPPISALDRILHTERTLPGGGKRTFQALAAGLPDGTFIEREGRALLVWKGRFLEWSFSGYREPSEPVDPQELVTVLTPPSVVRTFGSGFEPEVHPTTAEA
jgi:hypothetical protein